MLTQHDIDCGTDNVRRHKRRRLHLYRQLVHWTRDYWGTPRDLRDAVLQAVRKAEA